jgi:DNA-binding SARP family transcriptional activator
MSDLQISLFVRFELRVDNCAMTGFESRKVQELFSYLLLYAKRPHSRETLASLLWADTTTAQAKTYLRKAIWQLQTALAPIERAIGAPVLLVDAEWVQINMEAPLWLDIAELVRAYSHAHAISPEQIDAHCFTVLRAAAELYRGDLLDGWYHDWCLFERERAQICYIALLSKLMQYCELHSLFGLGVAYGSAILRCDRAHEQAHVQLMRLYCLTGDRVAALRQYDRCVATLADELGVTPAETTTALCEQIRQSAVLPRAEYAMGEPSVNSALEQMLGRLRHLEDHLVAVQHQVRHEIRHVERTLGEVAAG